MPSTPASSAPVPVDLDGLTPVPAGKIAAIVTYLEMRQPPAPRPTPAIPELALRRVERPETGWYRDLFRRIGEEWLWFSRLRMPEAELAALLADPDVEVYALSRDGADIGLVELDFRRKGEAELAFFGLVPGETGGGIGRLMMNHAIAQAFSRPLARFFVHTCSLDHPAAVGFYMKSGFTPVARMIEIEDDPRLDGTLARTAAPQIPIIG